MIFLSDSKEFIYKSYSLQQRGDFPVVEMSDVRANPTRFVHTQFLFSSWGMPALSKKEIKQYFPNLKALFFAAGSVQYFARPFLELGIRVFSAWAGNAIPVAEFSAAQIVLANKGYFQLPDRYRREGGIAAQTYAETFPGNYDTTVGLLGAGKIGRYLIRLLRPYRLKILVFDPFLSEAEAQKLGVQKASLETIFTNCQTISNHLADNQHTQGILNYSLFCRMRKNATFINTGRGRQVNEDDLLRALSEQPTRTTLLDVSIKEYTPPGTPLLNAPNIYMTPHRAGSFTNEIERLGKMMFDAYDMYLSGKKSDCEISADMLETLA